MLNKSIATSAHDYKRYESCASVICMLKKDDKATTTTASATTTTTSTFYD